MKLPKYIGTIHSEEYLKQIKTYCYFKQITNEQELLNICKLMIDSTPIKKIIQKTYRKHKKTYKKHTKNVRHTEIVQKLYRKYIENVLKFAIAQIMSLSQLMSCCKI